jgi:hypothetical protein
VDSFSSGPNGIHLWYIIKFQVQYKAGHFCNCIFSRSLLHGTLSVLITYTCYNFTYFQTWSTSQTPSPLSSHSLFLLCCTLYPYVHTYIIYTYTHIHTYIHTFPVVADKLNMKINIIHNFTSKLTGHGNIRSCCLHPFKILETPTCPCGTKDQTVDHLLYEWELVNKERHSLISTVLKTDIWPISKKTIRKHFEIFVKFTNEVSFDKLNKVLNPPYQTD